MNYNYNMGFTLLQHDKGLGKAGRCNQPLEVVSLQQLFVVTTERSH